MLETVMSHPQYLAACVTAVSVFVLFGVVLVLAMCQNCWPNIRQKPKNDADPRRMDVHTISNPCAGAQEIAAALGKINPVYLKDFDQDYDDGFVIHNPSAIVAPVHNQKSDTSNHRLAQGEGPAFVGECPPYQYGDFVYTNNTAHRY